MEVYEQLERKLLEHVEAHVTGLDEEIDLLAEYDEGDESS